MADIYHFSAPGRTEIGGNHTDHQHGCVIAAAVDMTTTAEVVLNGANVIRVDSEGYKPVEIGLNDLTIKESEKNTTAALIRGVAAAFAQRGYKLAGFDAKVKSTVLPGSGLSSSAAFEVLIGRILNGLFADNVISDIEIAQIGQYAENVYWDKASGMMDQMACAVGGPVLFDFADRNDLKYSKLDFSFGKFGHKLVIVNTGKGHADLSQEYSEIPGEMKAAAKVLGAELLHETTLENLLAHVNEIKDDRAILRAIHFFEETSRVERAADAIGEENYQEFLKLMDESGRSSWELLQNCYCIKDCHEQKIPLVLALTQQIAELRQRLAMMMIVLSGG